jgi:hypothetical protein
MKSISIIHPSRNRPDMAYEVAKKWIDCLSGKNKVEYIMSIDIDDPSFKKYDDIIYALKKPDNVLFHLMVGVNSSAIEAINKAAEESENNLLIVVSDDFDCFPKWDEWLLDKLGDNKDFIVKTNDGIQERLITLPIMDRAYYNRFGYIYYPEYKHMFCDTEMTDVGHILGRVIDLQDKDHQFLHKHYTAGFMQKDEINEKNDSTWNQGEILYNSRKSQNFFINV